MATPLVSTFADIYMSPLENNVLSTTNLFNPTFYIRYCDDTLVQFRSSRYVTRFIQELQKNSVLKFTCEYPFYSEMQSVSWLFHH